MSDLQETLAEALRQLDDLGGRVAEVRARAAGDLEDAALRLESRAEAVPAAAASAVARLHAEAQAAEAACAEAALELGEATARVREQQAELEAEAARALADLDGLRGELSRMRRDLEEREEAAARVLEASAARTREALRAVASDLDDHERWVSRDFTPGLAQQRQALDAEAEALRRLVAESALPALAAAYEETRDRLAALAAELRAELEAQEGRAGEAAASALEALGGCVDGLLAGHLQALASVRALFDQERGHLRGRADEFARHAEQHARVGDPAARGLKGLVDLVLHLEELLLEAGLLEGSTPCPPAS